jgi:hypothetical protein
MGTRNWHIARANRHLEVAEFLAAGSQHDWAAVALFYSAHQWVHSSLADEPCLARDERHPRKHTMPPGEGSGGRGTTQLVAAQYPEIEVQYRSLFEMSWRTRYDWNKLSTGMDEPTLWKLLSWQFDEVRSHCQDLNKTRPTISTQAP